jgi:hypothetical protein
VPRIKVRSFSRTVEEKIVVTSDRFETAVASASGQIKIR